MKRYKVIEKIQFNDIIYCINDFIVGNSGEDIKLLDEHCEGKPPALELVDSVSDASLQKENGQSSTNSVQNYEMNKIKAQINEMVDMKAQINELEKKLATTTKNSSKPKKETPKDTPKVDNKKEPQEDTPKVDNKKEPQEADG